VLADHRVVNRSVADALGEHDMTPGDIGLVINTHLHFDYCGQNAVFKHAAFYVQSAGLDRDRRESPQLASWFDFMDARFELLDGDAEILPGLSVVTTPGHTAGHQSVVVSTGNGTEVLIGDAAYKPRQYLEPGDPEMTRDSPGWQLAAALDRLDGDPVVPKTYRDSFAETALAGLLAASGVRRLIIAGAHSDYCVQMSALSAVIRGYDVTLASDGHTAQDDGELSVPRFVTW